MPVFAIFGLTKKSMFPRLLEVLSSDRPINFQDFVAIESHIFLIFAYNKPEANYLYIISQNFPVVNIKKRFFQKTTKKVLTFTYGDDII